MAKIIIQEGNYSFDASARTVTVTGTNQALFNEESLLMISNATDGRVIYNPQYAHTTGTFASNVLTLSENTELMSDSDELQIIVYSNDSATKITPIETGFVTTALLANGATYTSAILDVSDKTQVQTEVLASHDGTITISFCSDAAATDVVRSLTIPYVAANGYQLFAAPAFVDYIKYEFKNNGGVTQTDFYFTTKLLETALQPQVLGADAFISPSMVATLNRNIIVGQDGNGSFSNVTTVATSNAAGSYNSLQVVNAARPSELTGRTKVSVVIDSVTASASAYTVTASTDFYVTDIILTVDNALTTGVGSLKIQDGSGGTVVLPVLVQEAGQNETAVTVISHQFKEPILFDTEVYLTIVSGTLTISGIINGYEE